MARQPVRLQRNREQTEAALIQAVGVVLGRDGFRGVGVNAIARAAGVDKVLIYRYFGDLTGLVSRFAADTNFWPNQEELFVGVKSRTFDTALVRNILRNFLHALLARPLTLEILAWEMVERNELTKPLEDARESFSLRLALTLAERFGAPEKLAEKLTVVGAALQYLAIRSRHIRYYNGLDFRSESDWGRIIEELAEGVTR